jgi:protease I
MAGQLSGKRVAFLAADGVEQIELTGPLDAVKQAGADAHLISVSSGEIQGFNHLDKGDRFPVDRTVSDASVSDYDGLVLPGGVANPDFLRTQKEAVDFVRTFFEEHKPVSAICHAPWTLIEAGVLSGRTLTSWAEPADGYPQRGGNQGGRGGCRGQRLDD